MRAHNTKSAVGLNSVNGSGIVAGTCIYMYMYMYCIYETDWFSLHELLSEALVFGLVVPGVWDGSYRHLLLLDDTRILPLSGLGVWRERG